MTRAWLLLGVVLSTAPACGDDDDDSTGDDDAAGDADADGDGADADADGDGADADADGDGADADADGDGDGDGCGMHLDGAPCTQDDSCTWLSDCAEGRCDCPFGTWSCAGFDECTAGCPVAQDTPCGSSCTGAATDCLCSCGGGGPEFAGCACQGGVWACNGCGG